MAVRQGLSGFLEQDCFGSIAYLSYDAVGRGLGLVNRGGLLRLDLMMQQSGAGSGGAPRSQRVLRAGLLWFNSLSIL